MKYFSKILLLFLFIPCLFQCSLGTKKKALGEYKLKDGSTIELQYYGGGATAPSGILVKKNNCDSIIEDLDGFDDNFLFDFTQLNDTLLKITLTDTGYFKGKKIDRLINLKKRIKVQ